MPISQLGQVNISALNVPDVTVQIVPPQFLFGGVSTNKGGFVGTASWGPVNSALAFADYSQFARIYGPTVNRLNDLGGHVFLAAAQGGAGAFYGVRVTDGTDLAANAAINATDPTLAIGTITFAANAIANATITLNGTIVTFVASGATGNQVNIGGTLALTMAALLTFLQNSTDVQILKFNFNASTTLLYITAFTPGVAGNALTIAASVATPSGATLTGGTAQTVGLTLTAKYTGTLGNKLVATIGRGSQNTSALRATGYINLNSNAAAAYTITLNGTVFSFVASGAVGNQINVGGTLASSLANLLTVLQASNDVQAQKFTYAINASQLLLTAKAAGVAGNALTITTNATGWTTSGGTLTGGAAAAQTYRLTLTIPGQYPEQFDNLGSGLSGNALWIAIANAVNNGTSGARGPSALAIASAGAGTAAPSLGGTTLAGGTDGVGSITTSTLIGVDTLPRSGMYALRGTDVAQAMICDLADTTSFSTQAAFGLDIGCYMICTTAAGDTIANAVTELGVAGIDTFTVKVMFGDWIFWLDTTNDVPMRMSSPQSVAMGKMCNLSPQNSTLNKPILGIIGTQKSLTGIPYSSSDLQQLGQAQMDVIANPEPGGNYFACRFGKNTSSSQVIFGDEYTRVTYFLAKSLLIIGGKYIGETQTPDERKRAKTSIIQFLTFALTNGIIGTADGSQAFQVILDNSNNPQASVALGYQFAYVKVIYFGIVRYFIFNLEGGASVLISNTPPQN